MVKRKRTNNDLQYTTLKTKDRTTGIYQKPDVNSSAPEKLSVPEANYMNKLTMIRTNSMSMPLIKLLWTGYHYIVAIQQII